MSDLTMEIRGVDDEARTISGVVAPYDEVSYLTPDPNGERIMRGAFRKSIEQRGARIRLFVGHEHKGPAVGHATSWDDGERGLGATFTIARTVAGDAALDGARADLFGGLSVGFRPLTITRDRQGVREVREAALHEVSLVGVPSYGGAQLVAVRAAQLDEWSTLFATRPVVDLSPIPAPWLYDAGR